MEFQQTRLFFLPSLIFDTQNGFVDSKQAPITTWSFHILSVLHAIVLTYVAGGSAVSSFTSALVGLVAGAVDALLRADGLARVLRRQPGVAAAAHVHHAGLRLALCREEDQTLWYLT